MALSLVLLMAPAALTRVAAQDDPEYKAEIGAAGGMMNYLGDFNGSLTKGFEPVAAIVAKYRPNPRMAWTAMVSYGDMEGTARNAATWYPDLTGNEPPYLFTTHLVDVGVRFEYNFWAYGTGREYRGARPVVPFIFGGLGATIANVEHATKGAANMPLGAGVKCKLTDRVNLTAEWAMHFCGSDELDGVSDPYGIKSSGLFKNTDGYGCLLLTLTYDVWAKCKTCHNDQ